MSIASFAKRFLIVAAVVSLVALLVIPASAIETSSSITGVVTDPSGAVVPGAKVTVTNQSTGVAKSMTTGTDGVYRILDLPPGSYQVHVEASGFRTSVTRDVLLAAGRIARRDVSLEVGQVSETVTVEASGQTQVETKDTQVSGTISGDQIGNFPFVTRDWTELAKSLPGVQENSDRLGNSVNGGRSTSNSFLINGIDANDAPLNTVLITPNPDSIQEFQLVSNSMNAEYSRNSGSVMNAITKTGSNDFHGTLAYFYRVKGLSARRFFDPVNPDFIRHNWSATAGGPIVKDRTFFYWSYQGVHQTRPQTITNQRIYTAAERDADGDGFYDFSADYPGGEFPNSPLNFGLTVPGCPAGTSLRVCFPGARVPASSVSPVALSVINGVSSVGVPGAPLPNVGTNLFNLSGKDAIKNYEWQLRVDHHWANGSTIDSQFYFRNQVRGRTYPFTGATIPGFGDSSASFIRNMYVDYTQVFTPTRLNEFRIGFTRLRFPAVSPQHVYQPSDVGFTGITVQDPSVASAPNLVLFGGWFDWGFSRNGPQPRIDETRQVTDNFSLIHGKHTMKFGFDYRDVDVFNPFRFVHNGEFQYRGNVVPGSSSADPGLELLLGVPLLYLQSTGAINSAASELFYAYAQDQISLSRTVTLNLGVGYDLEFPTEQLFANKQLQMTLCPGQQSTLFPTGVQDPFGTFIGPPSGLCYPADPGVPKGTIPLRKHDFAPRIGIAWAPQATSGFWRTLTGGPGHFSVRAGYGIYYNVLIEETNLQFLLTPPFAAISVRLFTDQIFPFCDNGDPTCGVQPYPIATPQAGDIVDWNAISALPLNQQVFDHNFRVPYTQNYHLTFERKFGDSWLGRIAYVGARGNNLETAEELLDEGIASGVPNSTFPGGRSILCAQDASFCDPNIWQAVGNQESVSQSYYNSMQVSVEKRYSHGLNFHAAYTFAKSIDDASNNGIEAFVLTPRNRQRDRAFSNFDARHRLVVTYLWDVPAPKWQGAAGKVVRGWQLVGATTFASGFPVELTTDTVCDDAVNVAFFGGWCRPDLVGSGSVQKSDPRSTANNQYFSTGNFTEPFGPDTDPTATFQSLGTAPRSFFHGPGINNWDISILKNTYLNADETRYLQLRFEFFNAFNHTQFCAVCSNGAVGVNGNVSSSQFGQATTTNPARVIQLAVRFVF